MVISKSDFNNFTIEQLEMIKTNIDSFCLSNATTKQGKGRSRTTADKNIDIAQKIKIKIDTLFENNA